MEKIVFPVYFVSDKRINPSVKLVGAVLREKRGQIAAPRDFFFSLSIKVGGVFDCFFFLQLESVWYMSCCRSLP